MTYRKVKLAVFGVWRYGFIVLGALAVACGSDGGGSMDAGDAVVDASMDGCMESSDCGPERTCVDASCERRRDAEVPDASRAPDASGPEMPLGFVTITPGEFMMGSPPGGVCSRNTGPGHSVTVTRGFWMQATEVTQSQWLTVIGNAPSHFSCDGCPVERVSFWDALAYANELSRSQGVEPCYELQRCRGNAGGAGDRMLVCEGVRVNSADGHPASCDGYRLPTEAEWEYAARAGTTTATYNGDMGSCVEPDPVVEPIAWYLGNAGGTTHAVGGKTPNPWGLYDMLGNVWEWVWDFYGNYGLEPQTDPAGPETSGLGWRVRRGGSWEDATKCAHAAVRAYDGPTSPGRHIGFRVVRTVP